MKITMKRLASLVMAGALTLTMSAPAFAVDGDDAPKNQTVITGTYAESDIDVVVPATGDAAINPYGLGVTATKSDGSKVQLTGQIMTPVLAIKNKSALKLNVGATVSAVIKEGSTMKLATTTTKGNNTENPDAEDYVAPATGKSAFVELQIAGTTVTGEEDTDSDKTLSDALIDAASKDTTWAKAGKLTVGTKANTAEAPLATLTAATVDETGFQEYANGSIALFRLAGDCVADPKGGWVAADGFTATVVFAFSPAATK